MADGFFVEIILCEVLSAFKQVEFIFIHEIKQHPFFVAMGAVAFQDLFHTCFHLVTYCSAMAPASIFFHPAIIAKGPFAILKELSHTFGLVASVFLRSTLSQKGELKSS